VKYSPDFKPDLFIIHVGMTSYTCIVSVCIFTRYYPPVSLSSLQHTYLYVNIIYIFKYFM